MIMALSKLRLRDLATDGVPVIIREELEKPFQLQRRSSMPDSAGGLVLAARVPRSVCRAIVKVCLQPFVENSISHGWGSRLRPDRGTW